MDKTVVVSVERLRRHPIYKRVVRLSSKFKAHDEENRARSATRCASRRAAAALATRSAGRVVEIVRARHRAKSWSDATAQLIRQYSTRCASPTTPAPAS